MHSYRPNGEDSLVINRDSGVLTVDGQSWTMPAPGTTIPSSTDLPYNPGVRTVTGITDTLVLADNGKTIFCTNASGTITMTIPLAASVAFPLGARVELIGSANPVDLAGVSFILPTGKDSLSITGGTVAIRKVLTDTWIVSGALADV